MRVKNALGLLILAFLFTTAVSVAVADSNLIGIDLGEVNIENGLIQNDAGATDGVSEVDFIGDRDCRKQPVGDIMYYMYFTVIDSTFLASTEAGCAANPAWIVLEYYDVDQGAEPPTVKCNYGSGGNPWAETTSNFSVGGTDAWLVHIWQLDAPCFEHAQQGVADFRVSSRGTELWIDRVVVTTIDPAGQGEEILEELFPTTTAVEPTMKLATTWGALKK